MILLNKNKIMVRRYCDICDTQLDTATRLSNTILRRTKWMDMFMYDICEDCFKNNVQPLFKNPRSNVGKTVYKDIKDEQTERSIQTKQTKQTTADIRRS